MEKVRRWRKEKFTYLYNAYSPQMFTNKRSFFMPTTPNLYKFIFLRIVALLVMACVSRKSIKALSPRT